MNLNLKNNITPNDQYDIIYVILPYTYNVIFFSAYANFIFFINLVPSTYASYTLFNTLSGGGE